MNLVPSSGIIALLTKSSFQAISIASLTTQEIDFRTIKLMGKAVSLLFRKNYVDDIFIRKLGTPGKARPV